MSAAEGQGTAADQGSQRPLRIGLLGASRIAEQAVTQASHATGDVRAAVAARDPERARAYAAEHDYELVHDSYEALVADDSLDLIYIGLPNGLHAEWTVRALAAGRNVLVEKPFASNLAEFDAVAERLAEAPGWAWEAFHYADHPLFARLIEIVRSGEIGEVQQINASMLMPAPVATDPRWAFDLAGGGLMDVGCYAINGLLEYADAFGLTLELVSAETLGGEADDRVDARANATFTLTGAAGAGAAGAAGAAGDGAGAVAIPATMRSSMAGDVWDFSFEVIGSAGSVYAPNFVKPQEDDRLIARSDAGAGLDLTERVEHVGTVSSYAYQLDRVRAALATGERDAAGLERSRRTMQLIDAVYASTGMPLRPSRLLG